MNRHRHKTSRPDVYFRLAATYFILKRVPRDCSFSLCRHAFETVLTVAFRLFFLFTLFQRRSINFLIFGEHI